MKRHAPATARNSGPLAEVLARELPASGLVLEVASGSGEHAVFMARRFPDLLWQPSDVDPEALHSVDAWAADSGCSNLRPAIALDATASKWPIERADRLVGVNTDSDSCEAEETAGYRKCDACVCINMVHISEWEATIGLFRGCAKYLNDDAPIILYGPYLEDGVETAPSNLAFDRSLKERNEAWGLRRVAEVDRMATELGFIRSNRYEMPANNLTLVYRRQSGIGL